MEAQTKDAQEFIRSLQARNKAIQERKAEASINKTYLDFMRGLNAPLFFLSHSKELQGSFKLNKQMEKK